MVAKAPADRVVLLAIPPRDNEARRTSAAHNADLEALAGEKGWEFFDGLAFLRSEGGGFVEGTTVDGTHLTPDAERQFGGNVFAYLSAE